MNSEIITIGTEILLGEIVDTNSQHIARALRDIGLGLYWTSTVGDNAERIAEAVASSLARSGIVITTGGLGPTVDDPTREAIARAVARPLEFRPELWEQIQQRFARWGRTPTENNRRQAYLPAGAIAVENPVGTAPAFIVETADGGAVIALPGVPAEMEHLLQHDVLPYLRRKLNLSGTIKTHTLRVAGLGESQIDEKIGDLEEFRNPTVGLAAHSGIVDVRIAARAASKAEADELIWGVAATARQRLGDAVFGVDGDLLEAVALAQVALRGWKLAIAEAGDARLAARLAALNDPPGAAFAGGDVRRGVDAPDLDALVRDAMNRLQAQVGLGVRIRPGAAGRTELSVLLRSPLGSETLERGYGGPPAYAAVWAANSALNLLRLRLMPPI